MGNSKIKKAEPENILLGGGDVYAMNFAGIIPEHNAIETEENMIGGIKGGASITYTPTLYTVKDDMRKFAETLVVGEEVIFKTGYLKWKLGDLARLALSANLTETEGEQTLTIGGNAVIQQTLLRFVHITKEKKKFRITVVGVPATGFELAFNPEAESVINAEFAGQPFTDGGKHGVIIKIQREL